MDDICRTVCLKSINFSIFCRFLFFIAMQPFVKLSRFLSNGTPCIQIPCPVLLLDLSYILASYESSNENTKILNDPSFQDILLSKQVENSKQFFQLFVYLLAFFVIYPFLGLFYFIIMSSLRRLKLEA